MQGPATSLAYEPAEANVMNRPPRDITVERLVSMPLLIHAYITMGLAESVICLGAYLWVFTKNDVALSKIWMLDPRRSIWSTNEDSNDDLAPIGGGKEIGAEEQTRIVREVCLKIS
jgi:hypothetical protein